jgi:hypothetical protein
VDLVISGVGVMAHLGDGPEAIRALLGDPAVPPTEEVEEGLEVPLGRIGRLRNHPFSARYDRFGQIDSFSRYAFVAAGHALDSAEIPAPDERYEGAGVIFGTAFGCQEANLQFDQFSLDPAVGLRGASPLAFKGTVDNAPAGWVSVAYTLRGVNATFVSGFGAGAEAVVAAEAAIEESRAEMVVCGGVERLLGLQIAALHRAGYAPTPYAAEGSVALVLETAEAADRRGHRPLARLAAARRLPRGDAGALVRFLEDCAVAPDAIATARLATGPWGDREATETTLRAAGVTAVTAQDAGRTGQMFAAQAPLSLALMATELADGSLPAAPALLHATGEEGEAFGFVLTPQ